MMLFRVAEAVGSTVADLNNKITVEEFNGWVVYFNSKAPDVQEIQMAVLANLVATGLGAKNSQVDNYLLSKRDKPKEKENAVFNSFASIATEYKGPNE